MEKLKNYGISDEELMQKGLVFTGMIENLKKEGPGAKGLIVRSDGIFVLQVIRVNKKNENEKL